MSYITFSDKRKPVVCKMEQAYMMWQIKTGVVPPENDKQANYVKQVKAVYLAWRTAPDDYIEANWDWVRGASLGDWAVNEYGMPTKPSSEASWAWSRLHGTWAHGRPTLKSGVA